MSLSARVATHLPFLRRYARAATGSQASGDAYVAATLEATNLFDKRYEMQPGYPLPGRAIGVRLSRCW